MAAEDEIATEEYEERVEERRRRGWLPWLVLLLVLLAIAWLVCRYSDLGKAPDQADSGRTAMKLARVPDVTGLGETEAIKMLEAAGFRHEVETSFDAFATPGTVVSQEPGPGSRVSAGSTVFISVANDLTPGRGPSDAEDEARQRVPDVVGHSRAEALVDLEGNGFGVSVAEVYSASVPEGVIVDQTPIGGSIAGAGDTVGVIVSLGSEAGATVKVPALEGLTKAAAMERIRAAGLEPRVLYQPQTQSIGLVYQQSPDAGTAVPADRYIFILVGARP